MQGAVVIPVGTAAISIKAAIRALSPTAAGKQQRQHASDQEFFVSHPVSPRFAVYTKVALGSKYRMETNPHKG